MDLQIIDGAGTEYGARVNNEHQLLTFSVTETILERATIQGRSFNISTGVFSLIGSTPSAILYISNASNRKLIISEIGAHLSPSNSGTGLATIDIYKNSNDGTIITGANSVSILSNRNFGSAIPFDGTVFSGGNGSTVAGGVLADSRSIDTFIAPVLFSTAPFVLEGGTNITLTITPPTGNLLQSVSAFATTMHV